jgi:hypothetical protein
MYQQTAPLLHTSFRLFYPTTTYVEHAHTRQRQERLRHADWDLLEWIDKIDHLVAHVVDFAQQLLVVEFLLITHMLKPHMSIFSNK